MSFSALAQSLGVNKHNLLLFRLWIEEVAIHNERIRRSYIPISLLRSRKADPMWRPLVYLLAIYGGLRAHPKARACHLGGSFDPRLKAEVRFRGYSPF
jgi:hypothetical protein